MLVVVVIIICFIPSICGQAPGFSQNDAPNVTDVVGASPDSNSALKLYQKLFNAKRKEHWNAIKQILGHTKEKADKLVTVLVEGMIKVFKEARTEIEHHGFVAGSPFPDVADEQLKEALSKTLENAAFFADLALHFPDTVKKMYKSNKDLKTLANWAINFSNMTNFYEDKAIKLMHLVGQELGLVKKDPDYVNPYSSKRIDESIIQEENHSKAEIEKRLKKEAKRKEQKGPRLQGGSRSEL